MLNPAFSPFGVGDQETLGDVLLTPVVEQLAVVSSVVFATCAVIPVIATLLIWFSTTLTGTSTLMYLPDASHPGTSSHMY